MSIWSTLYALTEDDGLESTLIRPVFAGMSDIDVGAYADLHVLNDDDDYAPLYALNADDEPTQLQVRT